MKLIYVLIAVVVWVAACTGTGPGSALFRQNTPHEEYERSLKTARLDQTALGLDWTAAAKRALGDSLKITVPYRESGYFSANKPVAIGYRLNKASRGDKFTIRVEVQGRQTGRVFIDVFALNGTATDIVASAKAGADSTTAELVLEPRRTQPHLIRIQPELLRSGRYTITITRDPLLSFPVQGKTSKQIASYWGENRDGGKRRHEGIDVFAPRGTPVIAGVDGIITEVGVNRLGGNVVFLSDNERQQRLYYAHLDRFNVANGQRVKAGDTLGFVGNTGNARSIAPHLHFGIYLFNQGAVDPLPYVRLGPGPAKQELADPTLLGDSVRVIASRCLLRVAPVSDAPVKRELPVQHFMTVEGGTSKWLRVALPTGDVGYVAQGSFERIGKAIKSELLSLDTPLLDEPHPKAAILTTLLAGETVRVVAQLPGFLLVRGQTGQEGWVSRSGTQAQ